MSQRYRLDPALSRFTVQAFATGMLSFMGHSPTFAVRDFGGSLDLKDGETHEMSLEVSIQAASLLLEDKLTTRDRSEIESRMRREVLEVATFPEITFHADLESMEQAAAGKYRLRIAGPFTLHGVTRPLQMGAELMIFDDGVRLRGETGLRMSDYRIRPVTALAGAIKLKDELKLAFDLGATPEES